MNISDFVLLSMTLVLVVVSFSMFSLIIKGEIEKSKEFNLNMFSKERRI